MSVHEAGQQGAVHPSDDRRASGEAVPAKRSGTCVVCSCEFGPGDPIRFDAGEQGWKHEGC